MTVREAVQGDIHTSQRTEDLCEWNFKPSNLQNRETALQTSILMDHRPSVSFKDLPEDILNAHRDTPVQPRESPVGFMGALNQTDRD